MSAAGYVSLVFCVVVFAPVAVVFFVEWSARRNEGRHVLFFPKPAPRTGPFRSHPHFQALERRRNRLQRLKEFADEFEKEELAALEWALPELERLETALAQSERMLAGEPS